MTFNNPVWSRELADPFVLRWDGFYYAYGTTLERPDGRVFPVLRSRDLQSWELLGGALEPLPGEHSYWAPEVTESNGRFYMYYSAGGPEGEGHQVRVAVADSPAGPFQDAAGPIIPGEPFTIDAHPFRDPQDGRWYLFYAKDFFDGPRPGTGTAVIPLADDLMTPAGEAVPVVRATSDWQVFERDRHWYEKDWPAWYCVEGPFLVFRDGLYYCFYSGGCYKTGNYGIGFAVARHPLGPWQDQRGPVVLRAGEGVSGPGHNSVVKAPDGETDLCVYHAWDPEFTARRMCVAPLVWTPEGPTVQLGLGTPSGGAS